MHQDIEISKIFRRIKVGLDYNDFITIKDKFHKNIINISKNPNTPASDVNRREHRLKSTLSNGELVGQFNALFNLIKDFPLPKNFSLILNFNYDISNVRLLIDYNLEYKDSLNKEISNLIEEIFKKISLDQDLINILINLILPFKKVILIPSFRTLETSEKTYQDREIREINNLIETILEKSFDMIPINAQKKESFKIPNLALMLNLINREQLGGEYKKIMNTKFFKVFNSCLRGIFPDINLSIDFKFTELTTIGGYNEYGKVMGDWTKLGQGTQQLISLLFLLTLPGDCVYIIDEPENGLHPGLQSKLLYFIKNVILKNSFYNKQFFFASHSTSFIDFTGDCSHFICKKDEKKFSIEMLEKNKLQIIRNELGIKHSSLLQANGVIWVEGFSGKPYVNMLFQCFGIKLEELNVIIIDFGGGDAITSDHYTIDLLESINPNFCIIIDSEKDDINDNIDKLLEKKAEFEKSGHFFWILMEFRNIEGIIPQEVINEYFDIKSPLSNDNLKQPFENLSSYIKRLKNPSVGIIPADRKKYKKTLDAPKICELILSNPNYKLKIIENKYLKENIKKIEKNIEKWSSIEIFEQI